MYLRLKTRIIIFTIIVTGFLVFVGINVGQAVIPNEISNLECCIQKVNDPSAGGSQGIFGSCEYGDCDGDEEAQKVCVEFFVDNLPTIGGYFSASSEVGKKCLYLPDFLCECVRYGKTSSQKIKCIENIECLKKSPNHLPNSGLSSNFHVGTSEKATAQLGEKIDFEYKVASPDPGLVSVDCLDCNSSLVEAKPFDGGGISFTVDTEKTYMKYGFSLPATSKYNLIAWSQLENMTVFSLHEAYYTIEPYDCAGLISKTSSKSEVITKCSGNPFCFYYAGDCIGKGDKTACDKLPKELCGEEVSGTVKGSKVCTWDNELGRCTDPLSAAIRQEYKVPAGYVESDGVLPPCAFSGECRSVNDLSQLVINFGIFMLGGVGSFSFAMFIYGGFAIITSAGNAERVKKGWGILLAATVGLLIVISAYFLVDIVLDAIGVTSGFRDVK